MITVTFLRTPRYDNSRCLREYPLEQGELWAWTVQSSEVDLFKEVYSDAPWEEIPPEEVVAVWAVDFHRLDSWLTYPYEDKGLVMPPREAFSPEKHSSHITWQCPCDIDWEGCHVRGDDRKWDKLGQGCSIQYPYFENPFAVIIRRGSPPPSPGEICLEKAAKKYAAIRAETERLAATFLTIAGKVTLVDARQSNHQYNLNWLLMKGQKLAQFAVVLTDHPQQWIRERLTIATSRKDVNLVEVFGLGAGSPFRPFRVSLPATRLEETLAKLATV